MIYGTPDKSADDFQGGCSVSEVESPPEGCTSSHDVLLTSEAVAFVSSLVKAFSSQVDEILQQRKYLKLKIDQTKQLPDFSSKSLDVRHGDWKVCSIPRRLQCRHVDLGDVSPSNTEHFVAALKSTAQGIQTDFDDGHCPSWRNQLTGLYNVYLAVHNAIPGVPDISTAPVLMMRPRAWNMIEHNMLVSGRKVPGPLFDFGLLMFHNAHILVDCGSGPFFYLPKLEGFLEARLWNNIFTWTEQKVTMPHLGNTKSLFMMQSFNTMSV
ncbi:Bifunctional glyoxylate cycle protein [Lamellibrachia satsuma]|nr:Bifunctional glyoxylate cycle protein [Lamellibrachia satsuma]